MGVALLTRESVFLHTAGVCFVTFRQFFLFLTGAKIELRAVKTADRWLWLLAGFAVLGRRRRCLGFCFGNTGDPEFTFSLSLFSLSLSK